MWESLRMIFMFRCTLGAISKVCGKGGKQALSFSLLSTDRHFLGPVVQPAFLGGQPQSLKEFRFGLLHPPRRIGIADGCGDSLQRVDTQSIAQVLCRFLQQRHAAHRQSTRLLQSGQEYCAAGPWRKPRPHLPPVLCPRHDALPRPQGPQRSGPGWRFSLRQIRQIRLRPGAAISSRLGAERASLVLFIRGG